MANWARTLRESSHYAGRAIVKRDRHSVHFARPDGQIEAVISGAPCHYVDDAGQWQEIDTAVLWMGDHYGAAGVPVRLLSDRTVAISNSAYSQRTTRVGLFDPDKRSFSALFSIPVGTVQDDSLVASGTVGGAAWEHRLRLTESGVQETLMLAARPSVQVKSGQWVTLETVITGRTFQDGWIDDFDQDGERFPLPECTDAYGAHADCRRYARSAGGVQYIYTGIPVSWLAQAQYPITIDPDLTADPGDGCVTGLNADPAISHSTSSYFASTATSWLVGQGYSSGDSGYVTQRAYVKFDTSSIGSSSTVTQANMKLSLMWFAATSAYDVQICTQDWSAQDPIGNANREAFFDNVLNAPMDVVWQNSANFVNYAIVTSPNLNTSWIKKTGYTYYSLRSSRDYANTGMTTSTSERCQFYSQDNTDTTRRPVLVVIYTTAVTITPGVATGRAATAAPAVELGGLSLLPAMTLLGRGLGYTLVERPLTGALLAREDDYTLEERDRALAIVTRDRALTLEAM